jgi:hypothetical protein
MQRTAAFHDSIANARLPQADRVVDHVAALDAAVDGRDADAAALAFRHANDKSAAMKLYAGVHVFICDSATRSTGK